MGKISNKSLVNQNFSLAIYPPPPAPGGITLHLNDYQCLEEETYVNDNIINFYLKYLIRTEQTDTEQKRIHIFTTQFFSKLRQDNDPCTNKMKRHESVQSYTRRLNIFEKDFVIIPVHAA